MTSSAVSLLLCNLELMKTSEELDRKYGFTVFVPDFRFFSRNFLSEVEKKVQMICSGELIGVRVDRMT